MRDVRRWARAAALLGCILWIAACGKSEDKAAKESPAGPKAAGATAAAAPPAAGTPSKVAPEPAATNADPEPAAGIAAEPTAKQATGTPEDCSAVCKGARAQAAVGCVEGTLEELGFEMDNKACNDWEGAAIMGMGGDPCQLFSACKAAEGFSDAHCGVVKNKCL